ncbi:Winged helix DNA-binding domain superfamily [Arabidopsis thaliana x Arabidopsis arenosa]|uniref:Winged helix DNA-binding domain superfamily n=1 Tax=Arabidopsis thaliana x Arabidopsis arenosa TaxID=1240361 RepID=A0A8T1XL51_9BRAS|nr:Winged helix DNA-binding domain superfamily [Arabidopsis thaliana x Arabidopsis arenosa]
MDEENEQEPAFVRETGHGYGLYGHHEIHTNNDENNNSDNDQFNYRSDAYGNHDGRFKDDEANMIEEIANDVLSKLNLTPSRDFKEYVGIEDHIAKMSLLLNLESKEVRMVGIWGTTGIGKTIIARALFSRLFRQFQGSVFIDKAFISKSMKIYNACNPDDYNMKLQLQEDFLSKIFGEKDMKIDHLGVMEDRLKNKKVLIVIDDLDDHVVLDTLAGQTHWFGCGSRIIVITKDMHFLRAHGISHIYEVCLPPPAVALQILCQYAFKKKFPPEGLRELATEVALRAGYLPLGLHVMGSFFRGRDKEDWMNILPRLRNDLDGRIEKTLKVSYDGLNNKKDEAIFRHIACLFNGEKISNIKQLLLDSDLDVGIGFKNLVDKSLIHVKEGIVEMHRLLQEMGKLIVRTQSNEPGEREFLIDSKDICNVLDNNTDTKMVLGISLNMDETDELYVKDTAFNGMCNLLFLKFYTKQKKEVKWRLSEGFDYLPPKLRLLRLDGYPMRCLPSKFCPKNLVKLQMRESNLEKLWEGVHSLTGLKTVDMYGSKKLKEIPNLSMATNLEKLNLGFCSSLVELPSSIQYLNKLKKLEMPFCKNLETLPTRINLQSLNRLNLNGCSRLMSFPDISTNILELDLEGTSIAECPSNLRLENLVALDMCQMKSEQLWERVQVQPLTPLMTMLSPSLRMLSLSDIPTLKELPSSFHNLDKLTHLSITRCINLETLPTGINLQYLYCLDLSGCSKLRSFPSISTNISQLRLCETAIAEWTFHIVGRWLELAVMIVQEVWWH